MRECRFIRAGNNVYVPPTQIWMEGWTRQRWLERHFKHPDRILVPSLESWEELSGQHPVKILTEENNTYTEKDS